MDYCPEILVDRSPSSPKILEISCLAGLAAESYLSLRYETSEQRVRRLPVVAKSGQI